MKLWLNGAIVDQVRIDPSDRGFTLGDGLFETICFRKGTARYVDAHLSRLRASAGLLGIKLAYDNPFLRKAITEITVANGMTDAAVRVTLTRGPAEPEVALPVRARPTLLIAVAPLPAIPDPARVIVAQTTRRNEYSPLSRMKTLNYLDNVLARHEATLARADDALMLNTQGRLAGSTVANVFLLVNGGLLTPAVSEGALPGVMRGEVIRLTKAEEAAIKLDVLAQASEVFLTNALGIRPVLSIDDKPVGDGEPGLITQLLATRL